MGKIRSQWFCYSLVFTAWVAYILFSAATPQTNNQQQLHLSNTVVLLLVITLIVPYLLTWLIATSGWYHFSRFVDASSRKHLPNSRAFRAISYGLGFLTLDLIAFPFLSTARNVWMTNQHAVATLTITGNYIHVVLSLMAFGFLFYGSEVLAKNTRYAARIRSRIVPSLVVTVLFVSIFCVAVFSNPSRRFSSQPGVFATYYLPDLLIFLTIVVPLAVTWFLGLQTALNTERYVHDLPTPAWRKAILQFFYGLLAIVCSAIILQGLTMIGNQQLQKVNLVLLLVIIYLFIAMQAVGYLFIRISAQRLRRLSETGADQ